jgi:hypothetical protein
MHDSFVYFLSEPPRDFLRLNAHTRRKAPKIRRSSPRTRRRSASCSDASMDQHTRSRASWRAHAVVALVTLTLSNATIRAAGSDGDFGDTEPTRHVRTLDPKLSALIAEGRRRSPLLRELVDRLNGSTVFVYIETALLPRQLSGRLTFVGSGQAWRYLRIEIECRQSTASQVAALGHELQHAVEIANQTAAVDPGSIRALYGTIGFAVDDSGHRFESHGARAAGQRVRSDWLSNPIDRAGSR